MAAIKDFKTLATGANKPFFITQWVRCFLRGPGIWAVITCSLAFAGRQVNAWQGLQLLGKRQALNKHGDVSPWGDPENQNKHIQIKHVKTPSSISHWTPSKEKQKSKLGEVAHLVVFANNLQSPRLDPQYGLKQAHQHVPIIPVLRRQRQEDRKVKGSSMTMQEIWGRRLQAWTISDPISKMHK